LFVPVCLDERPVNQVHGKPNHEPIEEGHCEKTYEAKYEWRRMMEDRWLSVDDIAAYLGIKRDTVYRWISERNMPGHKIGRLWKFQKEEIDEWVKSGGADEKKAGQ
jgi:excisionase family DNA binding protein